MSVAQAAMDRMYRRQRHIYDLTRKFYLLGRDELIAQLSPPAGGTVLEIACGTGRNLIRAARAYPDARFYGLDVSEEMLATARANVAAAGLSGRIALAAGDATAFDAEALFGGRRFRPGVRFLRAVDDPGLGAGGGGGGGAAGARRTADGRRFWRPGRLAALVPRGVGAAGWRNFT